MFENLFGRIKKRNQHRLADPSYTDEFCLNCNADLRKQPGFSPDLDYWVCRSCNQLLTNPESELFEHSDIVWICDECGNVLNTALKISTQEVADYFERDLASVMYAIDTTEKNIKDNQKLQNDVKQVMEKMET